MGRVFTIRLEDGDVLPGCLEKFTREHGIVRGFCIYIGGIDGGSRVVAGPKDGKTMPPEPMEHKLSGVHEVVGTGTIFPDESGVPKLHSHASLGRKENSVTGCIRPGITVWKTVEIVLIELCGDCGIRVHDKETGFMLLEPDKKSEFSSESK